MKKFLKVLIISAIYQVITINAFAGSDGTLEINNKSKEQSAEVKDCFETVNRAVFAFNQGLDKVFFKPIAKGYRYLPKPIRSGTGNALNNLSNLVTIPNNILQGQFKEAGLNSLRFSINTTLGIAGIFDVASYYGLNKLDKEDYGQTFGSWGVKEGCYFVLPVLGPTTVRDSVGLIADSFVDPFAHITIRENELLGISGNNLDYFSVKGADAVDFRSDNILNFESLEKNSIDLYSSYKSIYLQDRENKINNSDDDGDDWGNFDN